MRHLFQRIVALPSSLYVSIAVLVIGVFRAAWGIAGLRQKDNVMPVWGLLLGLSVLAFFSLAVQRRHIKPILAAAQVWVGLVAANVLALVLMWPWAAETDVDAGFWQLASVIVFFAAMISIVVVPLGALLIVFARHLSRVRVAPSDATPPSIES
jgi:hypothetical protein